MIVPDLSSRIGHDKQDALARLVDRLDRKKRRHRIRQHYYDGLQPFKDLRVAIPPILRTVDVILGWPATAVDTLNSRVKMEAFVLPGDDVADYGIDAIWRENRMDIEAPQAQTSALIHAVAFVATTLGDVAAGEPEVLLSTYSATNATGLWHPAKRALGAALLVNDADEFGPKHFFLLFPDTVHTVWREDDNTARWNLRTVPNTLGRVPVEPLVYRPRLGRPFGRSRITRPMMSLTDSAMRTRLRAEVNAEFFSSPQRYLLGADESQFVGANGERKDSWDLLMGRILAIPADEETGDVPTIGQFPQLNMQPHTDQMRMWAQLFAAEAQLDLSQLGFQTDNPTSAEARYAAKEDLVIEAEATATGFAPAWINAMKTGVMIRENLTEAPDALDALSIRWRDPSTPSRAQAADATIKLVQAGILPADSEVTLEQAGLSDVDVQRALADIRRKQGADTIAALAALAAQQPTSAPAPETPPAEVA